MRLIDADKFLEYLIFSKHIDSLTCKEVKEAVEMCKVDVLEQIRAEIAKKLERPNQTSGFYRGISSCLALIDRYTKGDTDV